MSVPKRRRRILRETRDKLRKLPFAGYKQLAAQRDKLVASVKDRIDAITASLRRPGYKLYTRNDWQAAPARGGYTRNTQVRERFIHHTVHNDTFLSEAQEAAIMRQIQQQHFNQGWSDIGYHRVVFPSGRVYEGRPDWAIPAAQANHNTGTFAVAAYGNFEEREPQAAQLTGIQAALDNGPGKGTPIRPHSSVYATACPGKYLRAKLGGFR